MNAFVTLEARTLGRKAPLTDNWNFPLGPNPAGETLTLRRFIERVVREEVAAFRERQAERRFARVLSPAQIADGAARGKVDSGDRDLKQAVSPEAAVDVALQAFVDGLYLVLLDGQQQTDLDAEIRLRPGSKVTFVRLVALAGG